MPGSLVSIRKISLKIVVVAMVEHGGFGGSTSAPVAVRTMKEWHERNVFSLPAVEK